MKKFTAVILLAGLSACATTPKSGVPSDTVTAIQTAPGAVVVESRTDKGQGAREVVAVEVQATVKAVDLKNRTITLKGLEGGEAKLDVGPEVKRLAEIKAGDTVVVTYLRSLAYDLREPTAEELKQPKTQILAADRNDSSLPPGAEVLHSVKAIVTVVGIDRAAQTVTVKGPEGRVVTVKAHNPERLATIKLGDTAAVTYTEALAISVEPLNNSATGRAKLK